MNDENEEIMGRNHDKLGGGQKSPASLKRPMILTAANA